MQRLSMSTSPWPTSSNSILQLLDSAVEAWTSGLRVLGCHHIPTVFCCVSPCPFPHLVAVPPVVPIVVPTAGVRQSGSVATGTEAHKHRIAQKITSTGLYTIVCDRLRSFARCTCLSCFMCSASALLILLQFCNSLCWLSMAE